MAVTINGTSGITFNDATSQSTAAVAPTTTQVLNATAGAAVGAVGTYALLSYQSSGAIAAGATAAGSLLRYATANAWSTSCGSYYAAAFPSAPYSGTPAGTWRCMGYSIGHNTNNQTTLWLRIS
jgi:hypothetical protein